MDRTPKKPCKHCGLTTHFSYACYQNPKRALKQLKRTQIKRSTKPINKVGKTTKQWFVTRTTWIRRNPPDANGFWYCYLRIHPWCTPKLTIDKDRLGYGIGMLTLDHVVARTKDHSIKFKQANLKPACGYCNGLKGSKSLDQVKPKPAL